MKADSPLPPTSSEAASPAPAWFVSELHGALNWSLLIAFLQVVAMFRLVVILIQVLVALNGGSGLESSAMLGGMITALAVGSFVSIWSTTRFLSWVAAVCKLRAGSSGNAVEEVLRRQNRMWAATAVTAVCGALSFGVIFPQTITNSKKDAALLAERQAWKKELRERMRIADEGDIQYAENHKRRAAESNKEDDRLKKLEEEYYREKAAREAAEKKR